MAAWANAAIFAAAGLVNFTADQQRFAEVYDALGRVAGVLSPAGSRGNRGRRVPGGAVARLWGVLLAAPIAFGSVVMLLDHRHYLHAASVVVDDDGPARGDPRHSRDAGIRSHDARARPLSKSRAGHQPTESLESNCMSTFQKHQEDARSCSAAPPSSHWPAPVSRSSTTRTRRAQPADAAGRHAGGPRRW